MIDEWTRECLAIDVAGSIRSSRVIDVLARLISLHGAPAFRWIVVKKAADQLKAGSQVFGLVDQGVDYIHDGPHAEGIPAGVKAKVEELRAEVVAGRIRVPKSR